MTPLLKQDTYRQGLWAEKWAIWLFRFKGYHILHHRFQTPVGEIDIIAKRGNALVMIEVKARPSLSEGLLAITVRQQERCWRAASFFLARFPQYRGTDIQFDVVVQRPWRWPIHLNHVVFQSGQKWSD